MKAVGYREMGPIDRPDALVDIDLPRRVPTGRDLLVRVVAVSVNPVDTKVRRRASAEPGGWKVLGFDAAGEVVEIGPDVTGFRPGDQVYYAGSIARPGANSEFHLVDERITGHKPQSLSEAEAARALAVRLEGVVIGEAPPVGKAFVLWDGHDSIYVRDETTEERGTFRRGDQVELEAVSGVGGFTPSLYMRAGRRLGEGVIPAPREVTSDQLLTGQCDAQWVRVRGIVRQCEPSTVWAGRWRLTLRSGGQLLTVHVNDDLRPDRLVDAEVAVAGLVLLAVALREVWLR